MSSDLQRQDSLRTVLRNQKRRLSATERKQSSPDLTGGNGERKSPFSLRSTPSRSHRGTPTKSERGTPTRSTCTPPRKTENPIQTLQEDATAQIKPDFYSIEELSPLSCEKARVPLCKPLSHQARFSSPLPSQAEPCCHQGEELHQGP